MQGQWSLAHSTFKIIQEAVSGSERKVARWEPASGTGETAGRARNAGLSRLVGRSGLSRLSGPFGLSRLFGLVGLSGLAGLFGLSGLSGLSGA